MSTQDNIVIVSRPLLRVILSNSSPGGLTRHRGDRKDVPPSDIVLHHRFTGGYDFSVGKLDPSTQTQSVSCYPIYELVEEDKKKNLEWSGSSLVFKIDCFKIEEAETKVCPYYIDLGRFYLHGLSRDACSRLQALELRLGGTPIAYLAAKELVHQQDPKQAHHQADLKQDFSTNTSTSTTIATADFFQTQELRVPWLTMWSAVDLVCYFDESITDDMVAGLDISVRQHPADSASAPLWQQFNDSQHTIDVPCIMRHPAARSAAENQIRLLGGLCGLAFVNTVHQHTYDVQMPTVSGVRIMGNDGQFGPVVNPVTGTVLPTNLQP